MKPKKNPYVKPEECAAQIPSEATLLSCPFCGGDAKITHDEYEPNSWQVVCMDFNGCICGCHTKHNMTKQGAISRWNTRAR